MAFNNTTSMLHFEDDSIPHYRSWSPQKDKEKSVIITLIILCIAMINAVIFLTLFCYQMHNIGRRRRRMQQTAFHYRAKLLNKPADVDTTGTCST